MPPHGPLSVKNAWQYVFQAASYQSTAPRSPAHRWFAGQHAFHARWSCHTIQAGHLTDELAQWAVE